MNWNAIFVGLIILVMGVYVQGAELNGSCGNDSIQCELSLNNLELCNDSGVTETYNNYFKGGEVAGWFNVVPGRVTLAPNECTQLQVYTVANCYADPGIYSAELVIQNGETITTTCILDLRQGHFIELEVEPETQQATQCEEKIYDLVITNNLEIQNQNTERIDISIEGLPESWYSLEEERILLEKGETETVKLYVQAPCDADFGAYGFTAKAVLPNPNFFAEDNGEYILGQGQSIQILTDLEGNNADTCLETPTEVEFTIANNGKLADNVKLTLEGASFARLSKNSVSLDVGEKETISIFFKETSADVGEYDFTLIAESTVYDYSTSKVFTATLNDCYNIEVEKLDGQSKVCVEDKPIYKFKLTNNKTKEVELDVDVTGIGTELSDNKITLAPGESKILDVELDVSNLAKEAEVTKTDLALEIIIDSSGSMVQQVNGKNKMEVAKESIVNLVNNINEIELGLRVFGQDSGCADSELLVPVSQLNLGKITDQVSGFKPEGKTPMASALKASINDFPTGKEKAIILVSDGKETCEGNITEAANMLAAKRIKVYAVGFDIDAEGKAQLEEIANTTGGKYFEAKEPEQLIDVLQKISKELNIVPSDKGMNTFTLKLDSDNFYYEKDYSIEISDCYNATMVAPEINVCKGTTKEEIITLTNLGTEAQEFIISYSPPWVDGEENVTVEAGEEVTVPLTVIIPQNSDTEFYTVTARAERFELEQEKRINYLSEASCFGIDLIVLKPELDAHTCEGQKQYIAVENRGSVVQEITLTVDQPFVYIINPKVTVEPGERKEIEFLVSPPFDLPVTTTINFEAVTDRGFKTKVSVILTVTGNEESFGLGEVNIEVQDLSYKTVEGLDHDVEVEFTLYNDSNRTLEVYNATMLDMNGVVQIEDKFIQARSTVTARLLLNVAEDYKGEKITVPISIETDEGTYARNIVFDYEAPTGEEPNEEQVDEPVSIGSGLFSLANISTGILGFLIILIIGIILYSAYKASKVSDDEKEDSEKPKVVAEDKKAKPKKATKDKKTTKKKAKELK